MGQLLTVSLNEGQMKISMIVLVMVVGFVAWRLLSGGGLILVTPASADRVTAVVKQVVPNKEIVIEINNNSKNNSVSEITLSRATAAQLGVSPPQGFQQEPLPLTKDEANNKETADFVAQFNQENLRWVGKFPLAPDAKSELVIPAKSTAQPTGRIHFQYEAKVGLGGSISSFSVNLAQPGPNNVVQRAP
jgi:hypothetical protein